MPRTRTIRTSCAVALAACLLTSIGCEAIVGTDDKSIAVAPESDAAASSNDGAVPAADASAANDGPVSSNEASPESVDAAPPPVDASSRPADSSAPPATCPQSSACCGSVACVGVACDHCEDCAQCTPGEYCCATFNGSGKYKGAACSATPGC